MQGKLLNSGVLNSDIIWLLQLILTGSHVLCCTEPSLICVRLDVHHVILTPWQSVTAAELGSDAVRWEGTSLIPFYVSLLLHSWSHWVVTCHSVQLLLSWNCICIAHIHVDIILLLSRFLLAFLMWLTRKAMLVCVLLCTLMYLGPVFSYGRPWKVAHTFRMFSAYFDSLKSIFACMFWELLVHILSCSTHSIAWCIS